MKIQEQDQYHGPALMQIVEHPAFTALNKADVKYGHYLINSHIRLSLKYSTFALGPWKFTFQPAELKAIKDDRKNGFAVFVVLACGHHSICCLSAAEFEDLIDLRGTGQQWLSVEAPEGKQMRVTGSCSNGEPLLVPHNKFPKCIF